MPNLKAVFVAGHPVLDFLNTKMRVNGKDIDMLQCNADVAEWLKKAGFPAVETKPPQLPSSLLPVARQLREQLRALIETRKAGRRGDPSALNRFLAASRRHLYLKWIAGQAPKREVRWRQNNAAAILAPVAEAAADFLATGSFDLIKHCEGADCILWFVDQTKSHQRRWCSMEFCGNRHKVAAYRKRRNESKNRKVRVSSKSATRLRRPA